MKKFSRNIITTPTEYELVHSVTDFLYADGYKIRFEVSNMGQSIDILATKGRWITAIEVKRTDWKRALHQCQTHTLVADYVVLALALQSVSQELEGTLCENGLGLLLFDKATSLWNWELKPRQNSRVWKPQRQRFSIDFRKVDYAS